MEISRMSDEQNPIVELMPDGTVKFKFWRVENFHGTQAELALALLDWLKEQVVLPRDAPDSQFEPYVCADEILACGSDRTAVRRAVNI